MNVALREIKLKFYFWENFEQENCMREIFESPWEVTFQKSPTFAIRSPCGKQNLNFVLDN